MRENRCNIHNNKRNSLFLTSIVTVMTFFLLCNPLSLQAQTSSDTDADAAVATADASIDSIMDHSINMQGFNEAKSISTHEGMVVLGHDANTVTVSKKPEASPIQKKSVLVEMKPHTEKLAIPPMKKQITQASCNQTSQINAYIKINLRNNYRIDRIFIHASWQSH